MTEDTKVNPADKKVPLALKVFAVLSILVGGLTILIAAVSVFAVVDMFVKGTNIAQEMGLSQNALILTIFDILARAALSVQFVVFAIRILCNKRRGAAQQTIAMIVVAIIVVLFDMMIFGLHLAFYISSAVLLFLVVMHSYLDPSLAEERRLQRKLHAYEDRADAEAGVLGRDKTGKGYIQLNFFNIFWIFVVACFIGWCMEMAVCPFLNHRIEDRTGMLWGPFSPIYGFGAVLMVVALNGMYKKNPVFIYVTSAFIGAAFEFFVSYFFENAFGIKAWDYSDAFCNFQGRTDLAHAFCWGLLGLMFVRYILPWLLKVINKIPWNLRYSVTAICFVLMLINGGMTMLSFDCWFNRESGKPQDTPVAQFFADNFDNDFMAKHFPTMTMTPSSATRS